MKRAAAKLAVQPGLRERNKLDKLERIKVAAAELFAEKGFDAATTREIAKAAGVGLGTLFLYAEDKRDIVFLIFNDELDRITDEAFASADPAAPLDVQLSAAFSVFYRAFSKNVPLARILLKELVFFSRGMQAQRFHEGRTRTINCITKLVEDALKSGKIRADEKPEFISRNIFYLYAGAVRWWIVAERPSPARGIADLKRVLALQLRGLQAAAEPAAKPRHKGARA